MSRNREPSKKTLDRIAEAIRNDTHDPVIEAAAADRVRRGLGLPEDMFFGDSSRPIAPSLLLPEER